MRKRHFWITPTSIIAIAIVAFITISFRSTYENQDKFYSVNSLEDCKNLIHSIKNYCPSTVEIEPNFINKNSNPFLEAFQNFSGANPVAFNDTRFKTPAMCSWGYTEKPETGSPDIFTQVFTAKRLMIFMTIYESKQDASGNFTSLMEDVKTQTATEKEHGLDVDLKYPTPYSYEKETKSPVSTPSLNETVIVQNSVSLKGNIIMSVTTFSLEGEDPFCSDKETINLLNSF